MEREERLLAMNEGINKTLCDAALAGGVKDVHFLLASGAVATAEVGEALQVACRDGHLAVAKALLESGAAFSQFCLNQSLWLAASRGHTVCCELMLDHGADVRYLGEAPLCYAAMYGHLQTVTLLLDRGADAWSDRAMQWATYWHHDAVVALLRSLLRRGKAGTHHRQHGAQA